MNAPENIRPLRIIYVEDDLRDRELVTKTLARDGLNCEIVFVETEAAFQTALAQSKFDLILSDFTLPSFQGDSALAIAKELQPEVPFLFFSGTIGEERAVASLKAGAADYVLKQHLNRLTGAIRRALREATQKAEHQEAQLRLATVAQRMQLLLESSGEGIYGTDLQGRCTFLNRTGAQMIGWSPEEVLGRNMHELLRHHKYDGSLYQEEDCPIFQASRAGKQCRLDTEVFWRRDAKAFPVEYSCRPILEAGTSIGAVVTFTDITERKRAERALVLFRTLIDRTNDAIEVIDPETARVLDVNEVACQSHGYTREEFLQLRVPDLEATHDFSTLERWQKNVADIRAKGFRLFKGMHRRKNGSTFPVEINANYIRLDRDYIVSVVRDTTERDQAEAALRESEQRFRQVTESIDEVFWLTDIAKNQMIYISPAYQRIWGRTCESLYDSASTWLDAIHAEDRDRVKNAAMTLQSSGNYDVQYRIIRPDGLERWIHDRAFPIKDAEGKVYRLAGVAEDITRHRQLEDQFRQAQKMDAIGQLAGGIAHDFNNILGAIMGFTELARTAVTDNPEVADYLEQISRASNRATSLVKRILLFSRQHEQERKPMQLKRVVEEALKLLRATVPSSITFKTRLMNVPIVLADASSVHQVVMNLTTNAWHAMAGTQGTLTVELDSLKVDADFAALHPDLKPGPYVRLAVTDTGCGMDSETIKRIFDPFFTTKAPGEGTGLGLSVVHGIMKSHAGSIVVCSSPGEGTTFHLYFPAYESSTSEAETLETPIPRGQGERILLVDDEPALASLGKKTLERLGYYVTSKTNITEVLALFRDQSTQFDLVITDLTMPGMDGTNLARELRQIRADIPIILTTGYSGMMTPENAQELGFSELLIKPNTVRTLGEVVARVLAEKN